MSEKENRTFGRDDSAPTWCSMQGHGRHPVLDIRDRRRRRFMAHFDDESAAALERLKDRIFFIFPRYGVPADSAGSASLDACEAG